MKRRRPAMEGDRVVLDGPKVRRLRKMRGFSSQGSLSVNTAGADPDGVGVSERLVWDAEHEVAVTVRTWRLIAQALGVQPDELRKRLDSEPTESSPRSAQTIHASARFTLPVLLGFAVAVVAIVIVGWLLRSRIADREAPAATAADGTIRASHMGITSVAFARSTTGYTIEIDGVGFGSSPVVLPHHGHTEFFRIGDSTTGLEAGYGGSADRDRYGLTYRTWNDSHIAVTDYQLGEPGHCVVIGVWNPVTHAGAAWGGNIPPIPSDAPRITEVHFHADGTVSIQGRGFGSAPVSMPFTGNTSNLAIGDLRYHSFAGRGSILFSAGSWSNQIQLTYRSWSDTRIELSGFAGSYADGGMEVRSGDPVAITLTSTSTGLKTAWGGIVE